MWNSYDCETSTLFFPLCFHWASGIILPLEKHILPPYYFTLDPECYTDDLGRDYRGEVSVTESGKQCMLWTAQEPHRHNRTEERYPDTGLGDHSYCRNPDDEPGAWCFTMDPESRWEFCDIGNQSDVCDVTKPESKTMAWSWNKPENNEKQQIDKPTKCQFRN